MVAARPVTCMRCVGMPISVWDYPQDCAVPLSLPRAPVPLDRVEHSISIHLHLHLAPSLPLYLSLRQLNAALSMRMPKRAAIRGRSCAANWPIGGSICQLELLANTAQQG